jgi:hypothetical protein
MNPELFVIFPGMIKFSVLTIRCAQNFAFFEKLLGRLRKDHGIGCGQC